MLIWFADVAGAFALSIVSAAGFLRLLCRGVGPPFGPHARWWAVTIVVSTAIVATGLGLALAVVSHLTEAVYISLVLPSLLLLSRLPPRGDRLSSGRRFSIGVLTVPFSRLYDGMGDDMLDWCDIRLRAASGKPQWIADAVTYYYGQVRGGLKDGRALADLGRWQESITHKIGIVRLISLDTTPARLRASLQMHPSTQHIRKDADDDLQRLARRMESDALSELNLFLAYVYRLGYHKLLPYPHRPTAPRTPARRTERTGPVDTG